MYDTYEVEIHNNTATITQLNDENQETQIIENYKNKLRSQEKETQNTETYKK